MRMIQKQVYHKALLATAMMCGIVFGFFKFRVPSEPTRAGLPLHSWLAIIDVVDLRVVPGGGVQVETTNAAIDAIVSIGSEAIPWLRHELQARDFRLLSKFQMGWLPRRWQSSSDPSIKERHRQAAMATLILGSRAKSLAPELARLMSSGESSSVISLALARMGDDGVPPLAEALTNRFGRSHVLMALESTDACTDAAVPALLCVLTNGDGFPSIQDAFINATGISTTAVFIRRSAPTEVIPLLQQATLHTDWVVRASAVSTLQALNTRRAVNHQSYLLRIDRLGNFHTRNW